MKAAETYSFVPDNNGVTSAMRLFLDQLSKTMVVNIINFNSTIFRNSSVQKIKSMIKKIKKLKEKENINADDNINTDDNNEIDAKKQKKNLI